MKNVTDNIINDNVSFKYPGENLISTTTNKVNFLFRNSTITLDVFYNQYMKYSSQVHSVKYSKSIRLSLNHLKKYFGSNKLIDKINLADISDLITEILKTAPKGYRNYYRNYKAAFNYALKCDYIKDNPFVKFKLPKQQDNKPLYLLPDELLLILEKIDTPIIYQIIVFAYNTGTRVGEIVNLKIKNIDFVNRTILIGDSNFTTKSRRQRIIPMNEKVYDTLYSVCSNRSLNDFIFVNSKNKKFEESFISKKFKAAVRKAGLSEEIHFHCLRHSFGTILSKMNTPLYDIKELMGHSSIKTTEIYLHTDMENLRKAVNRIT